MGGYMPVAKCKSERDLKNALHQREKDSEGEILWEDDSTGRNTVVME